MKKVYDTPVMDVVKFESEDLMVTASNIITAPETEQPMSDSMI